MKATWLCQLNKTCFAKASYWKQTMQSFVKHRFVSITSFSTHKFKMISIKTSKKAHFRSTPIFGTHQFKMIYIKTSGKAYIIRSTPIFDTHQFKKVSTKTSGKPIIYTLHPNIWHASVQDGMHKGLGKADIRSTQILTRISSRWYPQRHLESL